MWWLFSRLYMNQICKEICSTNEGVMFAREFIHGKNSEKNKRFRLYQPLM